MKIPFNIKMRPRLTVACLGLVTALTAGAQNTTPSVTGNNGMTSSSVERRNDGFDWGWLGLLGLVGLAGSRRKNEVVDHNRTTTNAMR